MGLVTNSLTMIVFIRQGFKDSVNVSLFSIAVWDQVIAVWDQVKCLAGVFYRLHGQISLVDPLSDIFWEWASWPALIYLPIFAGYVSNGLATYVYIERCLSVIMPFKVKSLFQPRLTTCFMVALSVLIFGSFSAVFFVCKVEFTPNCLPDAQSAAFSLKIGTFHLSLVCFCVVCLYCIVCH